jgi:hypothetical protein
MATIYAESRRKGVKGLVLLCVLLLSGCAVTQSPESARVLRVHRDPVIAFPRPINEYRPGADEIRLFDSRVLRELRKSDPYQNAVLLSGPKKTGIIVGASIVGAYLVASWIADEAAFFPE